MSASITLLCEDQRTDIFVRRFLRHRFDPRDIYTLPLPTKGSGEQWVREQYPKQLRDIRGRQRKVLLVVTDADANTTTVRRSLLERQCDTEGISRTHTRDPVIVAIPRRNIETWLWHLQSHQPVDETYDYKPRFRSLQTASLRGLADELFRMCHREQRLLVTAPSSLQQACLEYPKLTRLLR